MAGVRHSMGGHAFARAHSCSTCAGSTGSRSTSSSDGPVQSGATWHDIQNRIHPQFAVKAMQSTDIFTVGGSISVNAHGMDHRGGIGRPDDPGDARDAAGRHVHTVSRDQDPRLFQLVVGGYGLFGMILDVELEVVTERRLPVGTAVLDYRGSPG